MAIPTIIFLYPSNTQVIEIDGLKDITTGIFINGATVTATLFNNNGKPDSILNGINMSYVPGSNGEYQGTVPDSFSAPLGSGYLLQITANQGGVQSVWSIPTKVILRSGV